MLRRQSERSAAIARFPGIDVNLAFFNVMISRAFESFSLATTCSHTMCYIVVQTVLVWGQVVRQSNTVASPAELVLHYHCLNTSCVGLHENTVSIPLMRTTAIILAWRSLIISIKLAGQPNPKPGQHFPERYNQFSL